MSEFGDNIDAGLYGKVYHRGKLSRASGLWPKGTEFAHADYGLVYTIPQAQGVYHLRNSPPEPQEPAPGPEPDPARLVHAIDVSSHQPRDLTDILANHPQVEHVVVKLYLPGESISQDHSIARAESARQHGRSVSGYFWCYESFDPARSVLEAHNLAVTCGIPESAVLWLDCETYFDGSGSTWPTEEWIRTAIHFAWLHNWPVGIYTAAWFWNGYLGGSTEFRDTPLWAADYNLSADLASVALFGGWSYEDGLVGHQYDVADIDLDVFQADALGL